MSKAKGHGKQRADQNATGASLLVNGLDHRVNETEITDLFKQVPTLVLAVMRYLGSRARITKGNIFLGDLDLRSLNDQQLRRVWRSEIALVPQDLHVPFPFRAGELVLMGRAPHQPLVGLDSEAKRLDMSFHDHIEQL